MKIADSILDLIGNTPMVRLHRYSGAAELSTPLLVKVESFNPAGSVKDRIAKAMLEDAERQGALTADSVIIEPTSGNTGIGLAAVASAMGYRTILTMPETMSMERRNLLKAYGAEVVLTPGEQGMNGAIAKAKALASTMDNAFVPSQFDNPANPNIHYSSTGPEIWKDTHGLVDVFVAGVGTGGTITGTGRYLKEQNPQVTLIAVEPENSQVLAGQSPGPHGIQGIGAGFVPKVMDTALIDEFFPVTDQQAYQASRQLNATEGILAGISAGAALYAATQIALREENQGKNIVVLLPDGGERYLSTPLFEED